MPAFEWRIIWRNTRLLFFHGEFPMKVWSQLVRVIAGLRPSSEIRKTLTLHGSGTHATGLLRCFHPSPCLPRLALRCSALLDNIIILDAIKLNQTSRKCLLSNTCNVTYFEMSAAVTRYIKQISSYNSYNYLSKNNNGLNNIVTKHKVSR